MRRKENLEQKIQAQNSHRETNGASCPLQYGDRGQDEQGALQRGSEPLAQLPEYGFVVKDDISHADQAGGYEQIIVPGAYATGISLASPKKDEDKHQGYHKN